MHLDGFDKVAVFVLIGLLLGSIMLLTGCVSPSQPTGPRFRAAVPVAGELLFEQ